MRAATIFEAQIIWPDPHKAGYYTQYLLPANLVKWVLNDKLFIGFISKIIFLYNLKRIYLPKCIVGPQRYLFLNINKNIIKILYLVEHF